ncbi:MAG: hypothetical protein ACTSU5_14765 [Promethearchaeota archaeon]
MLPGGLYRVKFEFQVGGGGKGQKLYWDNQSNEIHHQIETVEIPDEFLHFDPVQMREVTIRNGSPGYLARVLEYLQDRGVIVVLVNCPPGGVERSGWSANGGGTPTENLAGPALFENAPSEANGSGLSRPTLEGGNNGAAKVSPSVAAVEPGRASRSGVTVAGCTARFKDAHPDVLSYTAKVERYVDELQDPLFRPFLAGRTVTIKYEIATREEVDDLGWRKGDYGNVSLDWDDLGNAVYAISLPFEVNSWRQNIHATFFRVAARFIEPDFWRTLVDLYEQVVGNPLCVPSLNALTGEYELYVEMMASLLDTYKSSVSKGTTSFFEYLGSTKGSLEGQSFPPDSTPAWLPEMSSWLGRNGALGLLQEFLEFSTVPFTKSRGRPSNLYNIFCWAWRLDRLALRGLRDSPTFKAGLESALELKAFYDELLTRLDSFPLKGRDLFAYLGLVPEKATRWRVALENLDDLEYKSQVKEMVRFPSRGIGATAREKTEGDPGEYRGKFGKKPSDEVESAPRNYLETSSLDGLEGAGLTKYLKDVVMSLLKLKSGRQQLPPGDLRRLGGIVEQFSSVASTKTLDAETRTTGGVLENLYKFFKSKSEAMGGGEGN